MCEQASVLRPWPAFATWFVPCRSPVPWSCSRHAPSARRDQSAVRPTIAQIVGRDDTALVVGRDELTDRR